MSGKKAVKLWDPDKGNLYPRPPGEKGREAYDIRYQHNGISFRGTLRRQPPGARYAFRAEVIAIAPRTGEPVTNDAGKVLTKSYWSDSENLEELKAGIAKTIACMYADNATALYRAAEDDAVQRPETITPAVAAERFAERYQTSKQESRGQGKTKKRSITARP